MRLDKEILQQLVVRVDVRDWWTPWGAACDSKRRSALGYSPLGINCHGMDAGDPVPDRLSSEAERARVALKVDIIVIGAGQAGLSSAYHLRRIGVQQERGYPVFDRSPAPGEQGSSAGPR